MPQHQTGCDDDERKISKRPGIGDNIPGTTTFCADWQVVASFEKARMSSSQLQDRSDHVLLSTLKFVAAIFATVLVDRPGQPFKVGRAPVIRIDKAEVGRLASW